MRLFGQRSIVLASPRPVDTAVLAFSPLRLRYLQPFVVLRVQQMRGEILPERTLAAKRDHG